MKKISKIFLGFGLVVAVSTFTACDNDDDGGSSSAEQVMFSKADGADWTQADNQDRITDNVWITRANNGFIFNIAEDTAFQGGCNSSMPSDTEWAMGSYSDGVENLNFGPLLDINDCEPPQMIGQDLVLHLITDNRYYDVTFTAWSIGETGGQGGFSYTRIRRE